MKGPNGEFYDDKGELWAKDNIDREALPYVADVEMKYNKGTLPYMINEGKSSYFTKIVTGTVTKIVNVPILKNAGAADSGGGGCGLIWTGSRSSLPGLQVRPILRRP